jgi:hypothetical protein
MQGRAKAWGSNSGLLARPVEQALTDFRSMRSDEARAAFADKWISLIAARLEETWPALYELLRIVKERELYKLEASLEGQATYSDFASYFEGRTGKPFVVWCELEATYTFVAAYRPELLQQLYDVATKARNEAIQPLHAGPGAPEGNQNASKNNCANGTVERNEPKRGSNASCYLIARLKRDHPEIAEALSRGEYPSVRAAAKAAGFVRDPTPLETLIRVWDKIPSVDRITFLIETLTKPEREALIYGFFPDDEGAPRE